MRFSLSLLFFCSSLAVAAVDLNRATQAELESLPGIGPTKAEAIMDYRRQHGAFRRIEDLKNVYGIGAKTVEALRPDVKVVAPVPPVVSKPGQK
jgi:competence protein ComEA